MFAWRRARTPFVLHHRPGSGAGRPGRAPQRRVASRLTSAALSAVTAAALGLHPGPAAAGPAPSGSGGSAGAKAQVGTGGASGTSSARGGGFEWPERVIAGNAISFLGPLQFGLVGFQPRARFAFQYDRQLYKAHWLYGGVAILADRGDFNTFRLDDCGLETFIGRCEAGGVVGVDLFAGYIYKWYVAKRPYLVPYLRAGGGWGMWWYPDVGGSRQQERVRTWKLDARVGGGLRVFVLGDLGVGAEVNLPLGFYIHVDQPPDAAQSRSGAFALGIEVLPLVVEYRF